MTTQAAHFRAWCVINPPCGDAIYHTVADPLEGGRWIDKKANRQLQQPDIHTNAFGLQVLEDGDWCEWAGEYNGKFYMDVDELYEDLRED